MSSNRLILVLGAGLFIILIMGAALFLTFWTRGDTRYEETAVWGVPAPVALSTSMTDVTGDGQRDIFIQSAQDIRVLDAAGQERFSRPVSGPAATTLGDVTGDDTPEIILFSQAGTVTILDGSGRAVWERRLDGLGEASRALAVDLVGDGRREVVAADLSGRLVALTSSGDEMWRFTTPGTGTVRGLDDVRTPGKDLLVVGLESGEVVVLGADGEPRWAVRAGGGLRRVRAFPAGDPTRSLVFVGGVAGRLTAYDGETGAPVWEQMLGQPPNEIRPVELDGDPATVEIGVGGKDGGFWALDQGGRILWSKTGLAKVNEVTGLSREDLGGPLVVIGNDRGEVVAFDAAGSRRFSLRFDGGVERLQASRLGGEGALLVADATRVQLLEVTATAPPIWYTPLLAGLVASLIIGLVAVLIPTPRPAPTLHVSASDMSVAAQKARRRVLYESLEELNRMRDNNQVPENAYLGRKKALLGQLSQVTAALIALGEPLQVETFACPHCGGTLELGTDRCEYCGQVTIV